MTEIAIPPPRRSWKGLWWGLLPLLIVGAVLGTVWGLGHWTRGLLRSQAAFQITPGDIDCQPPVDLSRSDFLAEVQHRADLPKQLSVLEKDLPRQLVRAFSLHPWVESVRKVEVLPNRQVRVQLVYRTPQLAVVNGKRKWAIDGHGVLLPPTPAAERVPVFCGAVPPPKGEAGTVWGDDTLTAAARTVAFLHSQAEGPRFALVESVVTGLVLTTPLGSRVRWGQPVTDEPRHKDAAVRKWERLREHCRLHGDLDHPDGTKEYDLRSLD